MSVSLPNTNLSLKGSGLDKNGNKVVKIKISSLPRAFSIQTNGNLPKTGSILRGLKTEADMKKVSASDLDTISKEVFAYIRDYGTDLQKSKLKAK